jgi:hypothetical protein
MEAVAGKQLGHEHLGKSLNDETGQQSAEPLGRRL